jgi:Ca-activated chloride channel family protein
MNGQRQVWIAIFVLLCVVTAGAALATQQQPPAVPPPANPPSNQDAAPPADAQDPRYRLAVEVELVNITATVQDQTGKNVEGLELPDFQVFEDGAEQKVSFFSHDLRVPISVGMLLDTSGSMKHKLQQALQIVREVALALSPQDEMFLITFNDNVSVRNRFTTDMQEVQRSLRGIKSGGETTAYDAIKTGLDEMRRAKHNKKILLMTTDGFDTRSKINAEQIEDMLKRSQVMVYAIGIDDDENDPLVMRRPLYHIYHYMLSRLTGLSGGNAFRLFTGRNYALQSIASVLLEELHQQYTLSYYPTNVSHADFREVEIRVRRPGIRIRHRAGYYVSETATP